MGEEHGDEAAGEAHARLGEGEGEGEGGEHGDEAAGEAHARLEHVLRDELHERL